MGLISCFSESSFNRSKERANTTTTSESTEFPGESSAEKDAAKESEQIAKLTKKMEEMERKINLLTLGHLREKGERKDSTEDLCGSRLTVEAASHQSDSSPKARTQTERSIS